MFVLTKTYPAAMPATDGHFPGQPIIPGAWLLADALASVADELGWAPGACTVKSAKFLAPCKPGDTLRIEYSAGAAGNLKLDCTAAGAVVLSAQLSCPQSLPPTTA